MNKRIEANGGKPVNYLNPRKGTETDSCKLKPCKAYAEVNYLNPRKGTETSIDLLYIFNCQKSKLP